MEKISPEDSRLIDKALSLFGSYETMAQFCPWEARYIQRVHKGEKPMAESLRWALKKIIEEKKSPYGIPVREDSPQYSSQKGIIVNLDSGVQDRLTELARKTHTSEASLIQSAVIAYLVDVEGKDQLPLFMPSLLKVYKNAPSEKPL